MRIVNADLKIDVITNGIDEFSLKNDHFLCEYIPDLSIVEVSDNSLPDFVIKLNVLSENSIEVADNTVTINCSKKCSTKDVITLIDYGLEYCRQCKGIYCLHGSAVTKSNQAIVFLGQVSGIGKTSIALELTLKHEFTFLGDEKILIKFINGQPFIKSTNRLKFNKSYLEDYLQINEAKFVERFGNISNEWTKLGFLVQPQICSKGTLLQDKWDHLKTEFHLYEEITRKIRGCSRRVNNFTEPVLSIDTYDLSKKRSDFCRKLSQKIPAYHIVGDKLVVGEFLNDLLSRKLGTI